MTFIGTPKTKISQWPITSLCITQLFPEKFRVAKAKISAAKIFFAAKNIYLIGKGGKRRLLL